MFWYCLLIEIVVLVSLAWMEKLPQFVVNVMAGLVAFCLLAVFKGNESVVVLLGVCALLGFFVCMAAWIVWRGIWLAKRAISDPRAFLQALDIVAMQNAVAKSLAGKPSAPHCYGNRRVAQEVVRALKDKSPKE